MKSKIISALAVSILASSAFAADSAKSAQAPAKEEMQTIQCIPGTLAERQAQNRTMFDKNMAEAMKEKVLTADDVKKMKVANDIFVNKVMPFVDKKNPMMFCANIEADLKAKNIPFTAGEQPPAAQAAPAAKAK